MTEQQKTVLTPREYWYTICETVKELKQAAPELTMEEAIAQAKSIMNNLYIKEESGKASR